MKMKVEMSFLLRRRWCRTGPTPSSSGCLGLLLIQKVPPPSLASPPPESNQRISLQVWKQQQLEFKWSPTPFLCLNAGTRKVFGQLDAELERTSHSEDRLNPAHSCGGRDGFGGANRAFAQTMGGPLLPSKSVNCRARLFWSLLKCLWRPDRVEKA